MGAHSLSVRLIIWHNGRIAGPRKQATVLERTWLTDETAQWACVGTEMNAGGLKVKWHALGWKELIKEFASNSIGSEMLELEAT